jgi:hypothetical protein
MNTSGEAPRCVRAEDRSAVAMRSARYGMVAFVGVCYPAQEIIPSVLLAGQQFICQFLDVEHTIGEDLWA